MLRTSLRIAKLIALCIAEGKFLSSNAQDFIEDIHTTTLHDKSCKFLSSNAQDFIEDQTSIENSEQSLAFLSSNAQDFIGDVQSSVIPSCEVGNS